jgi:hypothetical protein
MLYGLKQASREWNILITNTLKFIGFTQLKNDSCIFIYNKDGIQILLALYVDDMIIGFNSEQHSDWLFSQLSKNFIVKQNKLTRCLSYNIEHDCQSRTMSISKDDYAQNLVNEYADLIAHIPYQSVPLPERTYLSKLQSPQSAEELEQMKQSPYREILGKLQYYQCTLRIDIAFTVNLLLVARLMDNPGLVHWITQCFSIYQRSSKSIYHLF